MISIKKNVAPKLQQCKFLCDGKLDQKLDDYEQNFSMLILVHFL